MLFYYRIFIPLHPSEAHNTFANIYTEFAKLMEGLDGWNVDILSRRRTDADAVDLGLWIMKPRAAI